MKALHIKETPTTPKINLNPETEIFEMIGKSLPTNSIEFYEPVFDWANEFFYSIDAPADMTLDFKLDYYNTSSSKQIAKLFRIIENSPTSENIIVNWFYDEDDIDMLEAGERFGKLLNINFEFSVNEE
ncbi:MAG: nuclear pore complex subunit [Bacteroidetes bacterium]|nr:MAG: nuclear pore complex subunit [Bacteroidota bacterium]